MALTKNLSLTQTLGAVFLCITILMISLSVTSLRGIERVGAQFNQLSEQALPFALNNAALTQNFLEQVKYLGYGTRSQSEQELNQVLNEWQKLDAQAGDEITRLQQNVQLLSSAEAGSTSRAVTARDPSFSTASPIDSQTSTTAIE
ncbi:hypothetical protein VC_1536 [Vibrio cholerae O1 biovar El Tor str. N16961]|uniref:Methyl-accepting chemotaxis protein n=1 Tax=Vibrio cholerae serotype O1 (strain ATCC 39315 / El Tor Inaba N16961) TaxID=243277 RepID=Q9KRU8_VIBCH|nr:hypothetical protein VC_1536 [Vibrio cholerae O1 biovar El Tor str. N16961]